jgi:hypothetical protein
MEISIYSTIDFSKSRNLLTERQKNIKAFNPIVPRGGCISLLELNPKQYSNIKWTLINEKTGKVTETAAESSDGMHYVAIPEGLRFGTYTLKIVTTRTVDVGILKETTISNPFEFVEASEDIITIVSRNLENDLTGNMQTKSTVIQPIYTNPTGGGGGVVYERKSETFYSPSYISYLGFAPSGSSESNAVWTITKRVGSADGTIVSNVQSVNKKWTERTLL